MAASTLGARVAYCTAHFKETYFVTAFASRFVQEAEVIQLALQRDVPRDSSTPTTPLRRWSFNSHFRETYFVTGAVTDIREQARQGFNSHFSETYFVTRQYGHITVRSTRFNSHFSETYFVTDRYACRPGGRVSIRTSARRTS